MTWPPPCNTCGTPMTSYAVCSTPKVRGGVGYHCLPCIGEERWAEARAEIREAWAHSQCPVCGGELRLIDLWPDEQNSPQVKQCTAGDWYAYEPVALGVPSE